MPKRWSQEFFLAQTLTRRILQEPYFATVFGGLLYKRIYHRAAQVMDEKDLGGDLSMEVAFAYLEPSDVSWAYLEAHGEAPAYEPTPTRDMEAGFLF
jgi:hypothetical protein